MKMASSPVNRRRVDKDPPKYVSRSFPPSRKSTEVFEAKGKKPFKGPTEKIKKSSPSKSNASLALKPIPPINSLKSGCDLTSYSCLVKSIYKTFFTQKLLIFFFIT